MDASPPAGFRPWWLLGLIAVILGQAGLALDLFTPGGLTDPRPVTSGRHPLHLYHGTLGAETFRIWRTTACYDPAYQAGYPKTPVFDGGSRPAEFVLVLAGPSVPPAVAYKVGLFLVCLIVPGSFAIAAWAAGLSRSASVLAAVGGCLLWWTPPVRALLDAGSVDLLLAGLMGLVFLGGLTRYADRPGMTGWVLMSVSAIVGWYAHPIVWLGLLPVLAGYYVAVAPRHGLLWHLGLAGVTVAGLAPNLWWLWDWGRFWWLRQPSVDEFAPFPEWRHFVGSESDLIQILGAGPIGWVTVAMGLVGASVMVRSGSRIAAGLIVLTAGFALSIARLGSTWPPLMSVQADRVAPAIAAVLMIPAAFLVGRWWAAAAAGPAALTAATLLPLLLGWGGPLGEIGRVSLGLDCRPFRIGLTADQLTIVSSLKALTTSDARILVEDPEETPPGWNWTALLATLTDRPILGGLDPGACVEHVFCGLGSGKLNTRPFADWTPSERTAFVQRYNVGWVLCRTPAAADFWREEPTARELGRFRDGSEVILFQIDRPYSYILVGSAIVERIQRGRVVLTDVIPNSAGEVVLSLHHQPGLRAGPTGVTVDTDKDPFDPIPMIKLLIPGPVSRVALTWHNP